MTLTAAQDATLKTLAVMTHADSNINQVEVETVQKVMQDDLGVTVSSADVRVAAHYEFIEDKQVTKYLKSVAKDLTQEDKKALMKALVHVVRADDRTSEGERSLFNDVASTLGLTAADLVNL